MAQFTIFLHRLGAFAANVAQTFLQTYGGGNGDPQVFDESAKPKPNRKPKPKSNRTSD
ncbi:hypothetical protein AB0O95_02145 [Rhodoglobus sp. NPDC076762]